MLAVAHESQPKVAAALGYDNVEFRRGLLEKIPLENASVDVVTSNCVINLSPDKPAVFREMWRVLKDHGRAVVADIVAETDVPPAMRADGQLWGECISGALSEEAFLSALERDGALSQRVSSLSESLLGALARAEAYIDFPEEDLPPEDRDLLRAAIASVLDPLSTLLATERYGELLRAGVRTVIIGETNAGKSSLLNRLLGWERATALMAPDWTAIRARYSCGV
jgi:SAM-dependent methyltransferase